MKLNKTTYKTQIKIYNILFLNNHNCNFFAVQFKIQKNKSKIKNYQVTLKKI